MGKQLRLNHYRTVKRIGTAAKRSQKKPRPKPKARATKTHPGEEICEHGIPKRLCGYCWQYAKGADYTKPPKMVMCPKCGKMVKATRFGSIPVSHEIEHLSPKPIKDMKPLIWRSSIGHYGGMFVEVPAEHLTRFKAAFPKRMLPREIKRTEIAKKWSPFAEEEFHKRFPESGGVVYEMFFGERTKGLDLFGKMFAGSSVVQPFDKPCTCGTRPHQPWCPQYTPTNKARDAARQGYRLSDESSWYEKGIGR